MHSPLGKNLEKFQGGDKPAQRQGKQKKLFVLLNKTKTEDENLGEDVNMY